MIRSGECSHKGRSDDRSRGEAILKALPIVLLGLLLGACEPEDQTPGLWLSGDPVTAFPDDWSFSNEHREIAIEVATPYFIPHSVTIWCAEVSGELYVAAAQAAEKNWPGWVDDDPRVVLKIGQQVYEARLVPVEGETETAPLRAAYAAKYNLGADSPFQPGTRYWHVQRPG